MTLEDAYRINTDTLIRWGGHKQGRKSFMRMATCAMNEIQYAAGLHRFGHLPTQERLDGAIAELRLLERML